jgi:hypothetical protein
VRGGSSAVVLLFGACLILAGLGFGGYAIMLALTPKVGPAGAAALTAAIMLVLPVAFLLWGRLRKPPLVERAAASSALGPDAAMLAVLARMSRDQPLMAIFGAGLIGAAGMLLKNRSDAAPGRPGATGSRGGRSFT